MHVCHYIITFPIREINKGKQVEIFYYYSCILVPTMGIYKEGISYTIILIAVFSKKGEFLGMKVVSHLFTLNN